MNNLQEILTCNETITPLDALVSLVESDLAGVNDLIIKKMQSPVPLIPKLAGHLINAGGKRLRPLLTLASAKLCGYDGDRHINLAATVEFIHTATLLHDDVVDESDLRRGQSTANAMWGNNASVLVGDFLFSRAFEMMVSDGSLKVLDILSKASATIAEGEVHQLLTTNDIHTNEEQYFEVIKGKTAALFAAATQVGAVVNDMPSGEENALKDYGMNLGIAFQLIDDALDYSAKQKDLGKSVGDDFAEGKMTLPIILAYAQSDEDEKQFWHRCMVRKKQDKSDFDTAMGILRQYQALDHTFDQAQKYSNAAQQSLNGFPDCDYKTALSDIIDFNLNRGF